ncbi:MAG TPA: signal peptidase II, partial [Bacillota bacterium]|nr:signal peptidase II [Bacillota bacterium]
ALNRHSLPIIQDFFHFSYVRNSGAVFGIFEGSAEEHWWVFLIMMLAALTIFMIRNTHQCSSAHWWVFLIMMLAALTIFGIMFIKNDFKDKRRFWYTLSLTLLIAGAFGNAIDRVFQFDHNVVDFIDFRGIWSYVFNVADICLNVGIAIFIFDQFILEPKRTKQVNG